MYDTEKTEYDRRVAFSGARDQDKAEPRALAGVERTSGYPALIPVGARTESFVLSVQITLQNWNSAMICALSIRHILLPCRFGFRSLIRPFFEEDYPAVTAWIVRPAEIIDTKLAPEQLPGQNNILISWAPSIVSTTQVDKLSNARQLTSTRCPRERVRSALLPS